MSIGIETLIASSITGTIVGAIVNWLKDRSIRKKTEAETQTLVEKLPAEVESINIKGSEMAVQTMQIALESAQRTIEQLEADKVRQAQAFSLMEEKYTELQGQFAIVSSALATAQQISEDLRREIDEIRKSMEQSSVTA